MKLDDYLDRVLLKDMLVERYVRMQSHPVLPLNILNYTNMAQIDSAWNDVTRKCRGLIYNAETEEILARPFEKFFNSNQPEAPDWTQWPHEHIRVQDKMDGSLGILYPSPLTHSGWAVATRGSFTSEQALRATRLLNDKYRDFVGRKYATYLVEIIYPENRIVVNYAGREDLVLLDILDTQDGDSILDDAFRQWGHHARPFPRVERFRPEDVNLNRTNAEGYVITNLRTNERVKVKFEEYKRLHKLLTGVSAKTIWELLAKGEDLDTVLDTVPDEFYDWVEETAQSLRHDYDRIFTAAWNGFLAAKRFYGNDRKQFALHVASSEYRDILFGLLDDKDVSAMIWKRLKPEHAKAFWNVDEAVA